MPPPRRLAILISIVVITVFFLLTSFAYLNISLFSFRLPKFSFGFSSNTTTCPPNAFTDGSWAYKPKTNKTQMTSPDDALEFAGLESCASSREFYWHLASDREEQWDRFPKVSSWEWEPREGTCTIAPFNPESFVRTLVNDGGWLLVGDSITEGHFFSLSCSLYPHVIATPNYTPNSYFDRAWPQNIYLNPASPIIQTLSLPAGFNISSTPLVTFRRVDLLWTQEELEKMHKEMYPEMYDSTPPIDSDSDSEPKEFKLFSDEAAWSLSPNEYIDEIFTKPLPEANYGTLVIATAGHWTTTLFSGYRDELAGEKDGYGIHGVIDFFSKAMERWAELVQKKLDEAETERPLVLSKDSEGRSWRGLGGRGRKRRQVVVRAYLPGHEDCHDHREPWKEVQPFVWNWYNWGYIDRFNEVFQSVVSKPQYPNIHYLPIERPARLRPDAHASGDCLHIMAGVGVMEGWSKYIWHYVTKEIM
ncbi:hypothetical protein K435DRAFT_738269 [Dendrothele bispora CBS 962.96]|uniref:Uncharacterized protein n=1 Tax=Dendrothele bispora (strain CBS 962.96) TaxID=1314807 RepID=A0A4S8KQM5_DENBC|nr:hypothetical protein K435DRAFT_738269 [Dendrothele bispora CBS 962.96]